MKTGLKKIIVQTTGGFGLGGLMVLSGTNGRSGAGRVSWAWVLAWDWVRRGHERPWTWKRFHVIPAVKVNEENINKDCSLLDLAIAWLD
jgi:hypothetical protein